MKYLICGKRSLRKNQIGKHKLLLYPKKKKMIRIEFGVAT